MTGRSRSVLTIAILAGTAMLAGLGTWQVQRLQWKQALIAEVELRRAQPPASLSEMERRWQETADVDYYPVGISGRFEHSGEQYFFTTHQGIAGWNIYTPLTLLSGRVLIVNRGFVPDAYRDRVTRIEGQVEGEVSIVGLARDPVMAKPNRFLPDNEPQNRTYFWKNLDQMALAADVEPDRVVPFFVDAGQSEIPNVFPLGGTTIVSFPNNHLQYAITWYGLGLALLGVGGYLLFGKPRDTGT